MKSIHDVAGMHTIQLSHPAIEATVNRVDPVLYAPFRCKLVGVLFIPMAAIVADDTDYSTLTVRDDEDNTIVTQSFNTQYDSLDAYEAMLLDCEDEELDTGDVINIAKTYAASGLAIPEFLTVALIMAR